MPAKPSIAIIGNGNVGSALAKGLSSAGYRVQSTGDEPNRLRDVAQKGDVIVLAIPWTEYEKVWKSIADAARGKAVVDVSNIFTENDEFAGDLKTSQAERFQKFAMGAKVVKAFNTVFAQHMSTGRLNGEPLTTFVCGDDEAAKDQVLQLARDLGFDAVDSGPLANARWLEAFGWWNITLGYKLNLSAAIGFRLVRAGAPTASRPGSVEAAIRK